MTAKACLVLADAILLLHFVFVAFVVGGLAAIWIGYFAGWKFVRNPWFRIAHLLAMAFVVVESVFGMVCPLTTWEDRLRLRGGEGPTYANSFIQYWIHRVMFFEIPEHTFTIIYITFLALILLSLFIIKPRAFARRPS
jgi:hypothetical protein